MCLAKVYAYQSEGVPVLLREHVASIVPEYGQVKLVDLFGNVDVVHGTLKLMDLEHSAVYVDLNNGSADGAGNREQI